MNNAKMDTYQELLDKYNPSEIDIAPKTADELYRYYHKYTRILLDCVFESVETLPYVLTNEIRSMIGHLSEHSTHVDLSNFELQKAYGHFRRLNLDAMKILCDELDKSFSNFLHKAHRYPYHKIEEKFMTRYANNYFEARKLFLNAQLSEGAGSNSKKNVYSTYFDAVKKYIELRQYHATHLKAINKLRRQTIAKQIAVSMWSLANIIFSIIVFF